MRDLVTTEWLARHLDDPALRVADVRWYLDASRKGRDGYSAGHIPGAVFLDVDADLSAPGGGRGRARGRHPWPSAEQVSRIMGRAGIGRGTRVVAYDDQGGAVAARLWYLLRAYGHEDAAVLDGGIVKWMAEGRPVTREVPSVPAAPFEARLQPGYVLTKADMLGRDAARPLLDARAPERYRGETEPVDLRAGHIPGARNAPFSGNLTGGEQPVFLPPAELRQRYAALGAEGAAPVVYCGSGVTACHDLLALHLAGLAGSLYAGSWSEWSADESLPIETG